MDYAIRLGWFRHVLALMRAAHARESREWIRRMEALPAPDPGRRS